MKRTSIYSQHKLEREKARLLEREKREKLRKTSTDKVPAAETCKEDKNPIDKLDKSSTNTVPETETRKEEQNHKEKLDKTSTNKVPETETRKKETEHKENKGLSVCEPLQHFIDVEDKRNEPINNSIPKPDEPELKVPELILNRNQANSKQQTDTQKDITKTLRQMRHSPTTSTTTEQNQTINKSDSTMDSTIKTQLPEEQCEVMETPKSTAETKVIDLDLEEKYNIVLKYSDANKSTLLRSQMLNRVATHQMLENVSRHGSPFVGVNSNFVPTSANTPTNSSGCMANVSPAFVGHSTVTLLSNSQMQLPENIAHSAQSELQLLHINAYPPPPLGIPLPATTAHTDQPPLWRQSRLQQQLQPSQNNAPTPHIQTTELQLLPSSYTGQQQQQQQQQQCVQQHLHNAPRIQPTELQLLPSSYMSQQQQQTPLQYIRQNPHNASRIQPTELQLLPSSCTMQQQQQRHQAYIQQNLHNVPKIQPTELQLLLTSYIEQQQQQQRQQHYIEHSPHSAPSIQPTELQLLPSPYTRQQQQQKQRNYPNKTTQEVRQAYMNTRDARRRPKPKTPRDTSTPASTLPHEDNCEHVRNANYPHYFAQHMQWNNPNDYQYG